MRISDWSSDVCSSDLLSIQSLLFGSGTTRRNQAQDLRFDHHVHDVQQARTRIEPDQRIARLLVSGRVHQHEQRIEDCGSGLLEGHPMLVQVRPGLALVPDTCIAVILEVNIHVPCPAAPYYLTFQYMNLLRCSNPTLVT